MTREAVSFWKSISLNEIFIFWKPKISFTEMFHESMENQFSWNLMLRYMKYSERKISQCIPFFKHFSNKDLKTLYQQLIQIFQIYLKVTIHIWRPWKLSSFQEDSACPSCKIRPKFFHPLDLGHPIPNKAPSQMIINLLKENIIQGWLLYVIRSFFQVSFRFQYQLINLVWLSIDVFPFSWNLTICFFCGLMKLSKSITKWLLYINIQIFSTHFSINRFNLHDLKI